MRYASIGTGSAADVKHRGGLRKEGQKPVQPSLFNQTVTTVTRPRIRVSLVDVDGPASLRSHKATLPSDHDRSTYHHAVLVDDGDPEATIL